MYKCNVCGAVFDSPAEQKREVEYYPNPFGNGSEPYGGGYYDCCPLCLEEDFDKWEEIDEDCKDNKGQQIIILEKAIELAVKELVCDVGDGCLTCTRVNQRICSNNIDNCYSHIKEYFKAKAKEIIESE